MELHVALHSSIQHKKKYVVALENKALLCVKIDLRKTLTGNIYLKNDSKTLLHQNFFSCQAAHKRRLEVLAENKKTRVPGKP